MRRRLTFAEQREQERRARSLCREAHEAMGLATAGPSYLRALKSCADRPVAAMRCYGAVVALTQGG